MPNKPTESSIEGYYPITIEGNSVSTVTSHNGSMPVMLGSCILSWTIHPPIWEPTPTCLATNGIG